MSKQLAAFRADRDAFGHLLLDQLNGDSERGRSGATGAGPRGAPGAVEIIEREDGLIFSSEECRRYFAEYPDWDPMEQEAMRWLVPGRALDLGCGAGRVALYLQQQGYEEESGSRRLGPTGRELADSDKERLQRSLLCPGQRRCWPFCARSTEVASQLFLGRPPP